MARKRQLVLDKGPVLFGQGHLEELRVILERLVLFRNVLNISSLEHGISSFLGFLYIFGKVVGDHPRNGLVGDENAAMPAEVVHAVACQFALHANRNVCKHVSLALKPVLGRS